MRVQEQRPVTDYFSTKIAEQLRTDVVERTQDQVVDELMEYLAYNANLYGRYIPRDEALIRTIVARAFAIKADAAGAYRIR
jgi:hypothetical protein